MSSRLGSVSTYFNNYFESHTPKDEVILKPVERARTARFMDYAGNIPIAGMGVGLIRVIGSVVIGIIALIGQKLTKNETAIKYWKHLQARAGNEIARGSVEFAAFGILKFVLDRDAKQMESNSRGVLISFSRGRYVYFREDDHFYSDRRFEGNAKRHEGDGYDSGTELRFDEAAIQAAETGSTELR